MLIGRKKTALAFFFVVAIYQIFPQNGCKSSKKKVVLYFRVIFRFQLMRIYLKNGYLPAIFQLPVTSRLSARQGRKDFHHYYICYAYSKEKKGLEIPRKQNNDAVLFFCQLLKHFLYALCFFF
jgi:hypothetical protein